MKKSKFLSLEWPDVRLTSILDNNLLRCIAWCFKYFECMYFTMGILQFWGETLLGYELS